MPPLDTQFKLEGNAENSHKNGPNVNTLDLYKGIGELTNNSHSSTAKDFLPSFSLSDDSHFFKADSSAPPLPGSEIGTSTGGLRDHFGALTPTPESSTPLPGSAIGKNDVATNPFGPLTLPTDSGLDRATMLGTGKFMNPGDAVASNGGAAASNGDTLTPTGEPIVRPMVRPMAVAGAVANPGDTLAPNGDPMVRPMVGEVPVPTGLRNDSWGGAIAQPSPWETRPSIERNQQNPLGTGFGDITPGEQGGNDSQGLVGKITQGLENIFDSLRNGNDGD